MDSFKKKIPPKPNQSDKKLPARLNQTAFRQIQQQFVKNRTNNDKVMQSLERINAASLEKHIKTQRRLTEESVDQGSLEAYSNQTQQLNGAEASSVNNDTKTGNPKKSGRQKLVSELAFGNSSQISSRKPTTTRQNRTMFIDRMEVMTVEDDEQLKQMRNNIHEQYRRKLYDHEVYIKELLREMSELNDAWGRSREMLHQVRLEKEAMDREMRKNREEYGLLKEVLLKENQYFKCELRISQRETAQLRDRLNKLAGLKSADQMEQISEDEPTEQEQHLLEKLQALEKTVKEYSERLYRARQYELQIQDMNKRIDPLTQDLQASQQQCQRLQKSLDAHRAESQARIGVLEVELKQARARIAELDAQVQIRTLEHAAAKEVYDQKSSRLEQQESLITRLTERCRQVEGAKDQVTSSWSQQQQIIARMEADLLRANGQLRTQQVSWQKQVDDLQQQLTQQQVQAEKEIGIIRQQLIQLQRLRVDQEQLLQKKSMTESQQPDTVPTLKPAQFSSTQSQTDMRKAPRFALVPVMGQKILGTNNHQKFALSQYVNLTIHQASQPKEYRQAQASTQPINLQSASTSPIKGEEQEELLVLRRNSKRVQLQLDSTTQELKQVRSLTSSLQSSQQLLLKQIESYSLTKDELEDAARKQQTECLRKIESLQEQLQRCRYSKQTLEEKSDTMAEQFEKLRTEYDSLVELHEKLQQREGVLTTDIQQKEVHIEQLTGQLLRLQQHNEQLNSLQQRQCQECKRYERELNRVQAELRSTQYGYEDRILKIEDENESLKNTVTRIRAFSKETF